MAFQNSAGIENGVLEESAILFRLRPQSLSVRSVCLVAKLLTQNSGSFARAQSDRDVREAKEVDWGRG